MGKRNYEVYSAEYKMSAINQYQQSGMTIKAFAESIGVKPSTFYVWLRKYIKANNNNTSPNRLIDITSLVKSATPISSNTNHLSIKGVERTCDRVAIIKNGIIVSELSITDIKHNENKRYKIEFIKAADYDKFNKEDLNISCKEKSKKCSEPLKLDSRFIEL